ncbi:deazaflavin-dependent oxidoreductase (nitroreductase family) [Herbihabitans rhizosphaerae]|uniref:Deazaflavin-dependent oxidoreductase (Nitroreductase family) n=1 Tax=Herbihabitans rhizosphaerae TaxID=1872711 RepID=A0A4Q7KW81_9PSEU|nr:nitroreductase family deazaflavin-dependent oxidoreductase [Herbihabitans rhizosphaerae]RZS40836.1 deazaflavin-dependent oxidoreductase (nitroreductase family) [Herbihabitans rhizosphaerae]
MAHPHNTAEAAARMNEPIIEEFRANRGKVGGRFADARMILLTTTGARSGQRRTTPMVYFPDGDRLLVVASNAGATRHPSWFHNVLANPDVTVETGEETYEATATPLDAGEREVAWARITSEVPGFTVYQERTDRTIPVVGLRRAG